MERRPFSFVPSEEEDGDDEEEEEEEETMKEKSSREENGKLVHKTSTAWEGNQSQGGFTQAGPSSNSGVDTQLRSQRKTKRKPRLPNKELSKELSKQLNQEIQKTEDCLAHQNGRAVKTEPDIDGEDRNH